jgi:hypothetical protein
MLDAGMIRVKCFALHRIGINRTLQQKLIEAAHVDVTSVPDPDAPRPIPPMKVEVVSNVKLTAGTACTPMPSSDKAKDSRKRRKRG